MLRFCVFVLLLGVSLQSLAAPATAPVSPLFLNPYYPEFDQSSEELSRSLMDAGLENEINQYIERRDRLQNLAIEYVPEDAHLLQKNSFVMKRLMDRGTRRAMHSSWIKKSSIGRMADDVKNNMQADLEFKDSKEINHKFDFKIQAFQSQAFLQYSGFTKAQLRYDLSNGGSMALIFQHDLSPMSSIGIETTLMGEFRTQSVMLNVLW